MHTVHAICWLSANQGQSRSSMMRRKGGVKYHLQTSMDYSFLLSASAEYFFSSSTAKPLANLESGLAFHGFISCFNSVLKLIIFSST